MVGVMDSFVAVKRWLENRNRGKTFVDYFHECKVNKIAIYGAGDLGRLLYDEIKESDICIKYFIDRNGEGIHQIEGIPVIPISDVCKMADVDLVIISVSEYYTEVYNTLISIEPRMRIISLKEAVYEF